MLRNKGFTADDLDHIIKECGKSEKLDLTGNNLGEKGGGALADRLNEELPFVKHLILTGEPPYHLFRFDPDSVLARKAIR